MYYLKESTKIRTLFSLMIFVYEFTMKISMFHNEIVQHKANRNNNTYL